VYSLFCRFIRQEAQEKSSEIQVSAEEEFNISKLQVLESEKARIRRDFDRRQAQISVRKKVEYSKQLNASRLKVLQAREDAVRGLLKQGQAQLAALSTDTAKYKSLLIKLLHQGYATLKEPKVLVRCRKQDESIVREAITAASSSGMPEAQVDTEIYLPPGPAPGKIDDEIKTCCGGVVVTSMDGKIVCSNTLDDRLQITYSQQLPVIRKMLFD
jgi:V-type H+-transporting ATPase subunit E